MTKTGVVIGVGGQIGIAVARRLLSHGWRIRGLDQARAPLPADLTDVEVVFGDRNDDVALAAVMSDGADGLVDTIAYNSKHANQLLRFADVIGALAVISSVAVYADDDGHSIGDGESPRWPTAVLESQRRVAATDETYGGGKVKLEEALLGANRLASLSCDPLRCADPAVATCASGG
jgi:nucleoside-diphosphate-sugar epimerase